MTGEIKKVGVIGLGRMGSGIARNILARGFDLTVYNRTAAKMQPLVEQGATAAGSAKEAAAASDAVLTSLMDDGSVLENLEGEEGVLVGLARGAIHIGTTTVSPGCAKTLAELHAAHGSHYVAAPVLGRPDVAASGELRTLVAGDPAVIERCKPVLDAFSQMVVNVAEDHAVASSLKLAVNYMGASIIELMGQVYAFGEKSGIASGFLDLVMTTMFAEPALRDYATRVRTRDFDEAGFSLIGGLKDIELMLQASTDTRVALPYAGVIREKMLTAIAHGLEEKDWSATYEVTRMNAGLA